MKTPSIKILIKIVLSILFIGCLRDWPYGYYQLVRFTGMIGFIWLCVLDKEKPINKYIWLASAILINPIFKIALGREIWNAVDVAWVIIFVLTEIIDFKENKREYEKS